MKESGATDTVDTGISQMLQDIPVSQLRNFSMNCSFVRRAGCILMQGLGTPKRNPWLWVLLLINMAAQISSAYILQSMLYPLATGRDKTYPGLAGCLKNGCNTKPLIPGSPDPAYVLMYIGDFFWQFFLSMTLLLVMSYTGDVINAIMRRNITTMFQTRLLQNDMLLYRMTIDGNMDNIDQRITSDLQSALDGFCCVLFGNSADYLAYPVGFMVTRFGCSVQNCFDLPDVQTAGKRAKIFGMVGASLLVAVSAYIVPVNHVARIFYRGQRYEGDFRTTHTRAVLNTEQISTLRGEPAEKELAEVQFSRVDKNNRIYYSWQGVLLFLRLIVQVSIPACSYICLSITDIQSSTTANFFQKQVGDLFEYILYFPVFVERLAFACGATHRVGQLIEEMNRFGASPVVSKVEHCEDRIELRQVTANPPIPMDTNASAKNNVFGHNAAGGRSLFEGVNFSVKQGESACIVGPSGCGKSSLLRVIGGLWGIDDGVVVKPAKVGSGGMFFMPQKPYVFPGNLFQQILYPDLVDSGNAIEKSTFEKAKDCLKLVFLQHLVDKYGMEKNQNWVNVLSISEMQRLNFARMFFHTPTFCLADEATSALDLRLESFLYENCAKKNISMISIAHRPSVIPHHHFVIRYQSDKHSWEQVLSSSVSSESKFPTAGLQQTVVDQTPDLGDCVEREMGLNWIFFKRFFKFIRISIGKCSSQFYRLLILQFFCMGIYGALVIVIFRDFGTSDIIAKITGTKPYTWAERDIPGALNKCGTIIALNAVISVLQSVSALAGAWMAMKVQRAILREFHKNYFTPGVVYHVNRLMNEKGIDQRMVQDLSGLRESFAWIFGNPFAYCNYRIGVGPLFIVWSILLAYAFSLGWQLAIFLFGFMVLAIIWQVVASFITSKQVGRRQAWEGDLRLHFSRAVQNIETITFFGGQQQELSVAEGLLESLHRARLRYYSGSNMTSTPTITIYYWLQTGVYVMAAVVAVWWSPGSPDVEPKNLFTTINLDIIWSKVVQLMIMCLGGLGMVIGFTHRVGHVLEKVEQARAEVQIIQATVKVCDDNIEFKGFSVALPSTTGNGKVLFKNLNLMVEDSLSVTGLGKSSLLRVLAGMWPVAAGSVSTPKWGTGGIFFIPQANYAVQGTLAAQVVYPKTLSEVKMEADEVKGILEDVGLGYITSRWGLNKVVNWDAVLSGGECQRLGFARVLFHKPKFAIMDETTSALDMATEEKCIQAVKRRGITMISMTSRPSVAKYHNQQLELQPAASAVQSNQI